MTTRRRLGWYVLAISMLVAACGNTLAPTEVMVTVDAESNVRARSDQLHVVVRGGQDQPGDRAAYDRTFSTDAGDLEWPHLTALAPAKGDASRVYEVVATALDRDGTLVAEARAISGYVAHERLELRLLLEDNCIAKICGKGMTCTNGACVTAMLDPLKLAPFVGGSSRATISDSGTRTADGSAMREAQDAASSAGSASGAGGARHVDAGIATGGMGGAAGIATGAGGSIGPDAAVAGSGAGGAGGTAGVVGAGSVPRCEHMNSSDTPFAAPNGADVASTITVGNSQITNITQVAVTLLGSNTDINDLIFNLTHDAMTRTMVDLTTCNNSVNKNPYSLTFDSNSSTAPTVTGTCDFLTNGGTYSPAQSFNSFFGTAADGRWQFTVADNDNSETNYVSSWTLRVCGY